MFKCLPNLSIIILLILPFLNGCIGYNYIAESEPVHSTALKAKTPPSYWESIPVYDDDHLFDQPYKVVATIKVTGDQNSFDDYMIEKMQKEASLFSANAIIFKNSIEVERNAVNGLGIGLNILGIFGAVTGGGYIGGDFEMGGKYVAYQYEGIAIKFY